MKRALLFLFFAAAPTAPSTTKALPPPPLANRFQISPEIDLARPLRRAADDYRVAALLDTATGETWYACAGGLYDTPAWCPLPRIGGTEVKP